jgi:hypothetical protein
LSAATRFSSCNLAGTDLKTVGLDNWWCATGVDLRLTLGGYLFE